MEDNNLKNKIVAIKKIKMTALEKQQVFENIINSPIATKIKSPVKSSWFTYSLISRTHMVRLAYYSIAILLIISTGGGAVFASENSLPDSIFYPVKVNVIEPIHEALTFNKEAKANYESNLATKRMIEAETLATQGKLDVTKEEKLNTLLVKHSKKLTETIDKIDQTEDSEQVDDIVTNFQANMNAHARVLDSLTTKEEVKEGSNIEDRAAPKMQLFSAMMAPTTEKKVEKTENPISKSARMNANDLGNKIKNKEDVKFNKSDKFKKKKDSVKSIIDKTTTNINDAVNKDGEDKQTIIDNTNGTLNEAQQLLDDADVKEQSGDNIDAYKTLLDSESRAKESNIFLEESLKWKGKNHRIDR